MKPLAAASAEAKRDKSIADYVLRYARSQYVTERPGAHDPFLTHEALHTAMILTELVDNYLCEHEAVREKPAWLGLAEDARKALFNLYQAIGKEHLK